MSRAGSEFVTVRPSNNIYTVLAGVALVAVILGMIAIWAAADHAFGGLFSVPQRATQTR